MALAGALRERGVLVGGDGRFHPEQVGTDRLSAPGRDVDYRLTDHRADWVREFGIDLDGLVACRRPLIRYCLDWSEQRHHLAGALGAALAQRLFALQWLRHAEHGRAVFLTDAGATGLKSTFGIELDDRRP